MILHGKIRILWRGKIRGRIISVLLNGDFLAEGLSWASSERRESRNWWGFSQYSLCIWSRCSWCLQSNSVKVCSETPLWSPFWLGRVNNWFYWWCTEWVIWNRYWYFNTFNCHCLCYVKYNQLCICIYFLQ